MEKLLRILRNTIDKKDELEVIDSNTFKLANFHSVTSFLKEKMDEDKTDNKIVNEVNKKVMLAIKKDTLQLKELDIILKLFEDNNIDCIPLKGSVLKHLYPDTYIRTMADIDILVKDEDYKKAFKLIKTLGYNKFSYSEHHIECEKPPYLIVEIHHELVRKANPNYYMFDNIFTRAIKEDNYNHVYKLTNEDFYLFMIAHMLKHYYQGGIGIRALVDIKVFLDHYPNLDFNYINKMIENNKLKDDYIFLHDFAINVFNDNKLDEKESIILDRIIKSGTYGTIEFMSETELKENGSTFKVVLTRVFPSISYLKAIYLWLDKCIILLPIAYIINCFRLLARFPYLIHRVKVLKKVEKENKTK